MEVWEIMDMGRPLKNFDDYMDKLKAYAKACELQIVYREEPCDGVYLPSRRKVALDRDLPESTEVAVLLHEIGHSLDDSLHDETAWARIDAAYAAIYDGKPTKSQVRKVVECEERAWMFARSIAKRLRIPLGKWFDKEEKECLESYRK